ncbi:MAG: MotA/TolQ/ExbB proton channel family protein [Gemmatimonadetes bacterium]|nr:MotA/TolQ/ExbB proton channel family protein [Gemmatimonadota bacterium]MCB9505653.1 MotA/TolQ/ExbB proton channel family protein [Gemmatimonadales bacterium]MCA9762663.1 MotA/TolQ/ExbB proton channel family protein [Gemmatimonadota bacterium]MCA9767663.1 MotA/TolQ/ExbB proton channel family protein [Gemmatimonadota bacterium]MCB9517329.1 MotA/TolQ/ExbB proton channel family protein [Gemmatimonadales bacterium]
MDEGAAGASMDLLGLLTSASVETMAVLVVCGLFSLISWYVIFAKWREFRRLRSERTAFEAAVAGRTSLEAREQVVAALGRSPFADVVRTVSGFLADLRGANERGGVSRTGLSLTQLEALTLALDTQVRAEAERASRRIPWLATIASTAPLLGLFGTVLGIMQSFTGIASGSGSSNIAAVAPGIADALLATAAGLAAAIPAVIAYNIFTSRVERFEGELERAAQGEIAALGREGRL